MFYVKVKADCRWSSITAAGLHFVKVSEKPIKDEDMLDEIVGHQDLDVRHENTDEGEDEAKPRARRKAVKDDSDS